MSHGQVLRAMSGLIIGMFVAILSSTIVTNALPTIMRDLHGSQTAYTWTVTAALLATTATTTIWGKLADLFSKKLLVQLALVIYVIGSVVAGLSQNTGMLISARVIQGIGAGGLSALAQTIMAVLVSPRERGRYSGYIGAAFALGTITGPLIGGAIVDSSLGWRGCFYVCVPVAIVALIILQLTLHLPKQKKDVKVDVLGAFLITAAVCALLIWVSLAGSGASAKWPWWGWQTGAFVGGAAVLVVLFLITESKVKMPIVPLHFFKVRTIALASTASLFVGVAMFAGTIYLSEFFQDSRGKSPTMAGLSTLPMVVGLFLASTVSGQIITRTGRWKALLCSGGVVVTAGSGLLSIVRYDTNYWLIAVFMFLLGAGVGMMMQNLVLSVQNQVAPHELGAASSLVSFFRTLGGAIGVTALGAVMANKISDYIKDGLVSHHVTKVPAALSGGAAPSPESLPQPFRGIMESAYGHGIADIFLYAAPFAFLALLSVLFIKEVPLRTKSGNERAAEAELGSDMQDSQESSTATGDQAAAQDASAPAGLPAARVSQAPAMAMAMAAANGRTHHNGHGRHAAASAAGTPVPPGGTGGYGSNGYGGQYGYGAGFAQQRDAAAALPGSGSGGFGTADGGSGGGFGGSGGSGGGAPIEGHVRRGDGSPLEAATLTLIDLSGRQLARSAVDGQGGYRLDTPGQGSYVLIAAADGHQPQASTVTVGPEGLLHDLVLSGTSGLAGIVLGGAGGTAVEGATVVVTDARGEVLATGRTGADGRFRFGELTAGAFTLAVSADGHRPTAVPAVISSDPGAGTTEIEVRLRPGATLTGVVLAAGAGTADGQEQPLGDARVTLVDAAGNVVGATTTDADGSYAFADLDAGEYTVIASGYPPAATGVSVQDDSESGFDLRLSHPEE
ncbi:MFS transporter [Mangrovactinospora gilvigrisea]|uniref:MFS transporter n=2 Tax=Mangrovactinospora gilvigrisea TaxID=1428644 RepID=A0A1J7BIT4_9ACTN|nr:MFS transporter [Mangrovactinospora gilvigrisea]OIV38583.1 MFS transporter [Mangrovactinospora gilvigrisea]